MSTLHPDNVNSLFFAESTELGEEDEIQEAYYTFSHLGCDEQMWDCEGKKVDNYVVKKLLTKYDKSFPFGITTPTNIVLSQNNMACNGENYIKSLK